MLRLHRFLEFLGRPERDLLARLDLDGFAGRRVPSHLAARFRTWRMPRPVRRILSPLLRCCVVSVTKSPSTASACFFGRSWLSDKAAARCLSVTVVCGAAFAGPADFLAAGVAFLAGGMTIPRVRYAQPALCIPPILLTHRMGAKRRYAYGGILASGTMGGFADVVDQRSGIRLGHIGGRGDACSRNVWRVCCSREGGSTAGAEGHCPVLKDPSWEELSAAVHDHKQGFSFDLW